MNQLINDIFGDNSITLDCESGECLHYTQVPGYVVSSCLRGFELKLQPSERPDNTVAVALSAATAAVIFFAACLRKSTSRAVSSADSQFSGTLADLTSIRKGSTASSCPKMKPRSL